MGEILFLAHRIPFPPDRGDKIRSHNVLKRLARIAPVHVGTFVDDDADLTEEVELASLAASYCLVRRTRPLAVAGLALILLAVLLFILEIKVVSHGLLALGRHGREDHLEFLARIPVPADRR